jgi:TRAP-type C4-dicarboxylate transport system permease small subunit
MNEQAFLRRTLDRLYRMTMLLGAIFLVAICILITLQVVGRFAGMQFGGSDDLIAWALPASASLALAETFRYNGHIRVTLLIDRADVRWRRRSEIIVLAAAVLIASYILWSVALLVWDSFRFNDLAQGLLPVPLWIPQSLLLLGFATFWIALTDDLIVTLNRRQPSYRTSESANSEVFRAD